MSTPLHDSHSYGWNCTKFGSCKEEANNDIAGLGYALPDQLSMSKPFSLFNRVLLAFVMTAYTTLAIAWISYIFRAGNFSLETELSVLDRHFLQWVWYFSKTPPTLSPTWTRTLQRTILLLSDSHIATGLAILTAGFIQSRRLTIYHFHIVVYLAWLASSTHMTTITILRTYLRRHRAVLRWRVIAMTVMFSMLFVALALTSCSVWPDISYSDQHLLYFDSQVTCAWDSELMTAWRPDVVFSVCLVTAGYIARLSKLFISTSKCFKHWFRDLPGSGLKSLFDKTETLSGTSSNGISRLAWRLLGTLILGVYVDLRALFDLYESLLSELIWLSFSLLWGTPKIFVWRMGAPVRNYEDTWSFGQLLPLLLLLLPVVALPELYSGKNRYETSRPE